MYAITRRQLLGTAALGLAGWGLLSSPGSQAKKFTPRLLGIAAVESIDAATQQLFNSVHVVAPRNLVNI